MNVEIKIVGEDTTFANDDDHAYTRIEEAVINLTHTLGGDLHELKVEFNGNVGNSVRS